MKANSNLFLKTSSAKKLEVLKKEQQLENYKKHQSRSHLSSEEIKLVEEVRKRGDKISEKDVVFITKDKDGKIRWLEKGKSKSESKKPSGLKHIIEKHGSELKKNGIPTKRIPELIKKAVEDAKIVGISGIDRPVYETTFNKKIVHLAITISDNGYIVGIHLTDRWKEK